MQDRGYQHLNAKTLPQSRKRKKIVVLVVLFQESVGSSGHNAIFEEYWIVDGRDMPYAPSRKLIEYRYRQDNLGKFTKTPVHEDE